MRHRGYLVGIGVAVLAAAVIGGSVLTYAGRDWNAPGVSKTRGALSSMPSPAMPASPARRLRDGHA